MESYPLLNHAAIVHISLFHHLNNAIALKSRLVAASLLSIEDGGQIERENLNFAFIDAGMIISRLHLLTAINQALIANTANKLKTTTIHSEILYELEPGTNIIDSLKHFGLSASTESIIVVRVAFVPDGQSQRAAMTEEKVFFDRMQSLVEATLGSLDNLGVLPLGDEAKVIANRKAIRKIYKLNQDITLAGVALGSEEERQILEGLCASAVALKTVAS